MPIPEAFLDELFARNDIVDVVGSYVQLNKHSGANLFGLCPFHSEKTPSFSVNREKQIYHCFGCGKGGGVASFIMEMESLTFPEAVDFLAKRVGMTVPEDGASREAAGHRARLFDINRDAARIFYENLRRPECQNAVEYIRRRGISREMVTRFGLGAAPESWNALTNALAAKGYTDGEMLEAGLAKSGKHGPYDAFRNRLMFPVIDVRGNVIGFSGRILGDGEPKYLNSPDTPVFQKSKNLFALNLAKKTKRDMLLLVEGNVDVVSLHQAGFDCAVASLGTALTPEQARLMTRYTNKVVISYDSDGAGVKASQRAIGILESVGLEVRVLRMEGAKDPDELIHSKGADAFQLLLDKSENQVEYRLRAVKSKYDLGTDDGRLGYVSEVTALLASLPSAVERELFGRKVAEETGFSPEAISSEVTKTWKKKNRTDRTKRGREETRPLQAVQPRDRQIRYEDPAAATAEEGILRLLFIDPGLITGRRELTPELFRTPFLRSVFEEVLLRFTEGRRISVTMMADVFTSAEIDQLTRILEKPEAKNNTSAALDDYIERLRMLSIKRDGKMDEDTIRSLQEKYREKKGYGG